MNISEKAKQHAESCRFCWMCRHICPIGNADGEERNTARARALMVSLAVRGTEKLEDLADNMYECTLCGACTNNCVTGWDPKIFIQETKAELVLKGKAPKYIYDLIARYGEKGSVYGEAMKLEDRPGKTLFLIGEVALARDQEAVKGALKLLELAKEEVAIDSKSNDTGYQMYFLAGKVSETVEAAKACAEVVNRYEKVVVYNPMDLALILHQWKEWGIEVKAKVVSWNEELLSLIENKRIVVKRGNNVYTLQDAYGLAREIDDISSGRKLIDYVGTNREMLLHGKEANMAGNLLMKEYMGDKILDVARVRWGNAVNMECKTLVTESPDEHVLLLATAPEGYRVITLEEMILENIEK